MPTTQIASGRAFTYLDSMGRSGNSETAFRHPVAVARNQGDTLYVANRGQVVYPATRVTRCTLNHEWIVDIGGPGTGDGELLWPCSVALDSEEKVYVSDQGTHKIMMYENDGTFLGKWGTASPGDGELNTPNGIAFDSEDNLHVVDARNSRVQKFTKDGKFLAKFGSYGSGKGQFNMPWGLALDKGDNVYVADTNNDRVQKFSPDGQYTATFGRSGTGKGELTRPSDVAVDKDGDVYVCDWGNNRVHVYNSEGNFLVTFIGDAKELSAWAKMTVDVNPDFAKAPARADLEPEWRLRRPVSVAVGDDGRIVIAESQHHRLQVYCKDPSYKEPDINL